VRHVFATLDVLTQSGLRQITQRFIWNLYFQLHSLVSGRGHSSISRATVKDIILHYHRSELQPRCMLQRQRIMQKFVCGRSIGLDFTYKGTASLTAADNAARTSTQRRKCASFAASLATATVEHGFVLAAVISPSDSYVVPAAILCGLHHAQLPEDLEDDEYAQRVVQDVALPGCLHHFPVCIATDHVVKDKNLWKRIGHCLFDSWEDRDILSPWGALSERDDLNAPLCVHAFSKSDASTCK
jgi:hypothetical protein